MTLAIFDLDNTLIGDDSDHLWGQFVCEQKLVDASDFAQRSDQFYADYQSGDLDIDAYLRFVLGSLKGHPPEQLDAWHRTFMDNKIKPIMLPKAAELLADHRRQGHKLLIITATNRFITAPIAAALGVDNLIACEAEIVDGLYTGAPSGIPSFKEGKVTRLYEWLESHHCDLDGAWFYSDSHNDLPLLELVDNPVAVDPDDTLRNRAIELGWPVISLR
ncbi:putative phosphatase [Halioglobus japonicus]|nr:putative phosphatase [Halioglobus japonicus]